MIVGSTIPPVSNSREAFLQLNTASMLPDMDAFKATLDHAGYYVTDDDSSEFLDKVHQKCKRKLTKLIDLETPSLKKRRLDQEEKEGEEKKEKEGDDDDDNDDDEEEEEEMKEFMSSSLSPLLQEKTAWSLKLVEACLRKQGNITEQGQQEQQEIAQRVLLEEKVLLLRQALFHLLDANKQLERENHTMKVQQGKEDRAFIASLVLQGEGTMHNSNKQSHLHSSENRKRMDEEGEEEGKEEDH